MLDRFQAPPASIIELIGMIMVEPFVRRSLWLPWYWRPLNIFHQRGHDHQHTGPPAERRPARTVGVSLTNQRKWMKSPALLAGSRSFPARIASMLAQGFCAYFQDTEDGGAAVYLKPLLFIGDMPVCAGEAVCQFCFEAAPYLCWQEK